jgi:hypothetical protein
MALSSDPISSRWKPRPSSIRTVSKMISRRTVAPASRSGGGIKQVVGV